MEFDFGKTVEEIVMQAKENQEEFIFETIRPYCENVLQMKINKEELKQILLNSVQKQQPCDTPRNNLAKTSQDCISRAEVLECAYLLTDDEGITHEVVHADDIRYAAPVTWSGWTPATQPPEPNTAVLLYVRYKSTGRWTYQLGMWNDSKQTWEDWRTPYDLEEEFEIIEWMETPER